MYHTHNIHCIWWICILYLMFFVDLLKHQIIKKNYLQWSVLIRIPAILVICNHYTDWYSSLIMVSAWFARWTLSQVSEYSAIIATEFSLSLTEALAAAQALQAFCLQRRKRWRRCVCVICGGSVIASVGGVAIAFAAVFPRQAQALEALRLRLQRGESSALPFLEYKKGKEVQFLPFFMIRNKRKGSAVGAAPTIFKLQKEIRKEVQFLPFLNYNSRNGVQLLSFSNYRYKSGKGVQLLPFSNYKSGKEVQLLPFSNYKSGKEGQLLPFYDWKSEYGQNLN